jgi:subtilisin family serine protease
VERVLDSIGAVAARVHKARARRLLPALARAARASARSASPATARTAAAAELGGVTPVQPDRRIIRVAELDANLVQVGAPTAWAAGYSGQGVKLAVLDSGVDVNHPTWPARCWPRTTSPAPATPPTATARHPRRRDRGGDRRGRRRGPQGRRLWRQAAQRQGLQRRGRMRVSWIIDGMEWAAAQAARVVNLSLGGLGFVKWSGPTRRHGFGPTWWRTDRHACRAAPRLSPDGARC